MITEIVSPKKIIFSEDVDFIILPGEEGDFGVLDKHSPIISNLRLGLIYIYKDHKLIKSFSVGPKFPESDHLPLQVVIRS